MSLREDKGPAQSHADMYVAKPEFADTYVAKPEFAEPELWISSMQHDLHSYLCSRASGPLRTNASLESSLLPSSFYYALNH